MPSQYKSFFTLPDTHTYLNCAYMSPQLKKSKEIGLQTIASKDQPWNVTAADFFTGSDQLRSLLARIISADAEDVAIIPSASYGINTIAANLDLKQGDQILVMEDQFPSNYYPWYEKAKDCGASLKVVKRPENNDWTTAIINSLDEKVRLAALANVHWTDGTLIDLTKISVVCKQHDILLSADLTQSLGAMPFSVKEADVDFAVAAGYKWLLGPYSLGYMYVKKSHQQMRPLENNWINRAKSDEFSLLVEYTDEFQAGAKRFDVGERSNFFLTPIAAAGLTQILDWGVDTISAYSGDLTSYLATELSGSDIKIADAQFRCPHIIGLYTERVIESVDVLKQANIFVSIRGKSIRVSPHLYNDRADIDRLLEILKQ